jgi:hypothetical protein
LIIIDLDREDNMRRAALQGTKHSTIIHPDEPPIQQAIASSPLLTKFECEGVFRTGSSRRSLQLRPAPFPGKTGRILRGLLFIGAFKRAMIIVMAPGITSLILSLELSRLLSRFNIAVLPVKN